MAENTNPRMFHLVHRLHQAMFRSGDKMLGEVLGISTTQSAVLMYLKSKDGAAMGELADAVGLKITSMSGLVDRMEAKGLLRRIRSETDRRSFSITLTAEGKSILKTAEPLISHNNAALVDALGDTITAAQFAEACENLIRAADQGAGQKQSKIQKVS